MAIPPTDIRILLTNYDIITCFLNLAFCSEHFISIKHRILETFNINNNKKCNSDSLYAFNLHCKIVLKCIICTLCFSIKQNSNMDRLKRRKSDAFWLVIKWTVVVFARISRSCLAQEHCIIPYVLDNNVNNGLNTSFSLRYNIMW